MKRFFIFNTEKLKNDVEYFLVTYVLVIFIQLIFWVKIDDLGDIVFGTIFSIFFLYLTFMKKKFTLREVWKLFWKVK
ncbi:hypothetical protein [Clostridium sp. HV4-5-A1G]|uniref:hypothetical protein n=1 Tax=Clostridium sp. HV4-5-A1G TaxID=2004595 RepID=UPI00123BC3C1|nr:hypothetical protein [Clostridium sp. HV4-5-A1G]KAA8676358.1 hypothetical protein F3O63_03350 [Clostridium sp. HV4-5-A1G]CAB1248299.1 conserved hypothetical protein [Clostridiaceae bacterium BL-3]